MTYKIGVHEFKIIKADSIEDNDSISKKKRKPLGVVDWENNTIVLVNGMAETREQHVLFHEILHVIDFEIGINLLEKQIEAIGGSIYSQFYEILSPTLKEILATSEQFEGTYILTD